MWYYQSDTVYNEQDMIETLNVTIEQASLSERVYASLKELILSGTLKGGERIPEEQLAVQFGVSRTPIREALKRLSEYGLVITKPRSYVVVVEISRDEAMDIGRVRLALESLAVSLLAERADQQAFAELERLASECQYAVSIGERARAFELDSSFHQKMMEQTANPTLADTYAHLDARIQLLRLRQSLGTAELMPYMLHHLQLIQFLRSGDVEKAKAILDSHILHDFE
jgi:DNA-binding GntR family transcriptional regulator